MSSPTTAHQASAPFVCQWELPCGEPCGRSFHTMQKLASHVNAHLRAIAAPALHRRVAELRASGTMAPTFEPDYVEPEYVQCPQYSCEFRAVLPTEIMPFHIYSAHGGVYSTVPCNDGENFTIREIRNPTFSAPRSGSSATEVLTDNHTTSHEWTCTNVDRESLDDDYSLGDYFRVSGLNFDTVNDSGLGGSTNSCPVNGCGLGGALAWSTHAWNTGYPDDTDAGLQWALISSVHDFGLRPPSLTHTLPQRPKSLTTLTPTCNRPSV